MAKEKSSLVNNWRPMMGWTYMATCLFDFIIGPVTYNILQFLNPGQHVDMWQAITLQGGGLYHLSMGAVLGISAYGRTQEKINGATDVSTSTPPPAPPAIPAPAAPIAPAPVAAPVAAPAAPESSTIRRRIAAPAPIPPADEPL
jgi:hypothetical protein